MKEMKKTPFSIDIQENEYLVEGAELKCDGGTKTSLLKVSNSQNVLLKGPVKINCKDCKKEKNIQSFGKCTKVFNKECQELMDLQDKWNNLLIGDTKIEQVNGEDAVILHSLLLCNRGGIIIPQDSGQNLLMYTKNGKIIYNWDKIKKLFEKDPSLVTEKEFCYLVEVAKSLSESEDMVEFINCSYTKRWEYSEYWIEPSDTFHTVIEAAEYETIIKGITANISEEEYIKQIMKYEIIKETATMKYDYELVLQNNEKYDSEKMKTGIELWEAMQNFRFKVDDYESFKYPSWILQEQSFSYWPKIYQPYRDSKIVRYQGKGAQVSIIEGLTERNNISDINNNLQTIASNFVQNALYVYGLGDKKPIIQILIPTAASAMLDVKSEEEYDDAAFISEFNLHDIQIEKVTEVKESKDKVFPSDKTIEKVEEKNNIINQIQNKIEDGEVISLPKMKDEYIKNVKEWDESCDFFTLNDKGEVIEVKPISLNDIMQRPNMVNQYNSFLELIR